MISLKNMYLNYYNSKNLFRKTREYFEESYDIDNLELQESLKENIEIAMLTKNKDYLEYLMYIIAIKKESLNIEEFISYFNQLILEPWHIKHEDLALWLEFNGNDESVESLFKTIYLKLEYLEWDDNYALAVKCVWGIAKINGTNSKKYLEILAEDDNEIISNRAKKRLREYE